MIFDLNKSYLAGFILMLLVSLEAGYAATTHTQPEGFSGVETKPLVYGKHSMVVTNNPWATKAAHQMLKEGGSAADAAVAAVFVLGLTEPQSSGIGGGGFAVTYNHANKQYRAYDGRERAPSSATSTWLMKNSRQAMAFQDAVLSYRSVGVPGEVALLFALHRKEGRLPWRHLVQPAINLATQGFPMSPRLHALLYQDSVQYPHVLIQEPGVKAMYFLPDGNLKPVGARIKNMALAKSLAMIADNPRVFYDGKLAQDIITKVNQHAGKKVYRLADFQHYHVHEREALCRPYRTYLVCTTPFATGGVTVLELLKLYAHQVTAHPSSPRWLYYFLEASKLAYADRNQYIADPAFVVQPLEGLLDESYVSKRSHLMTPHAQPTPVAAGVPEGVDSRYAPDDHMKSHGTTALSIVDRQGNAVSMTVTIEAAFGSHMVVDGFLLNNELTDFSFYPQNKQGRPIANRVAALKRPRSAIAPVLVFDNQGDLVAMTGSPGGSYIICYVAKNLIQLLDFKQDPQKSAAFGNLCAANRTAVVEKNSPLTQVVSALKKYGEIIETPYMVSGAVNVKRAPQGGWYGAADPRREGMALGD